MESLPEQPERQGHQLLAAISNAMVAAMKQYYGRGPMRAKSYMVDDYLFVAMRDPLTVVEQTLLRAGRHDLVREYRQVFQNEMAAEFTGQIEQLTGRRVLSYQSQIMFDPDTVIEIFVLESRGDGSEEAQATAEDQMAVGEATPDAISAE
ncbi:MAG TPA: DUF2294 domain-containing protein [Thermoleophilaceae bacterium]|nr:DUF2294 domain-containing protein [Thermoleophilaceae bacterium]